MNSIWNECMEKIQSSRIRHRRHLAILLVLAAIVTLGVNWGLHQNGISMSDDYVCGYQEHQHGEECCTETLACRQAENGDHIHTAACYETQLVCTIQEHAHTELCMIDTKGNETKQTQAANEIETDQTGAESVIYADNADLADAAENTGNGVNAQSDDSIDLKDIENKTIVVRKSNGDGTYSTVGEDDVLTVGDDILIDIVFTTTAATFEGKSSAIVAYQLPNGIQLNSEQSGNIMSTDESGGVLGQYTIDSEGFVTMIFDESKINKNQKFTATLEFRAKAANSGNNEKGTYQFDGSDTKITVQKKADIDVEKELVSDTPTEINGEKYYHFKVIVSTENGTMGTVNIGDLIETSKKGYEIIGTYVEKAVNSTVTAPKITKTDVNGAVSAVDGSITIDNDEKTMNIENLPKLNARESYVLDYWVKLDESHITSSDGSGKFQNQAYANIENRMQETDEEKIEIKAYKPSIEKSGTYENGLVNWTIKVNNPGHDLKGYTVQDILTVSGETTIGQTIVGDIELTGYTGKKATVVDASVSKNADGTGFTYTFGKDMTADYYTFTYQTQPDTSAGDGTAANTAKLIEKGEEKGEAKGEADVSSGEIKKQALRMNNRDDLIELRWKITADNLKSGWTELTLTDLIKQPVLNETADAGVDAHYAIYSEIKEELEASEDAWTFFKNDTTATLDEVKAQGMSFSVKYYKDEEGTIEASKADDHVHRIEITIKKGSYDAGENGEITKIVLNRGKDDDDAYASSYHTIYDPGLLTRAGKYAIPNKVTLNHGKSAEDKFKDEKTLPLVKLASDRDPGEGKSGDYEESGVKISYNYDGDTMICYSILIDWEKGSDSLTVTDTLPEGVEFAADTAYAQFRNGSSAYSSTSGEKTYNINEDGHFTAAYDESTRTVTFTISGLNSKTKWDNNFKGFAIRYGVKVTDSYWDSFDPTHTEKTYTNTVRWNGNTATSDVEVDRTIKNIIKSSAYDKDRSEVSYTIEINPYGTVFTDSDGKVLKSLTLKDDLTIPSRVTASLNRTTIKLTDENGNPLSANEYTFDVSEKEKDNNNVYHMQLTVPNGKHLTLKYTYKINRIGQDGMDGFEVSNTAKLNGESSGKKKVKVDNIDSSSTVQQTKLTIYKVDSEHMDLPLTGAQFTLYVYNTETKTFEEVGNYISNSSGEIPLTYTEATSSFRADALYKLVETRAPSGYNKREEPVYFIWHESSKSEADAFQAATGGNQIEGLDASADLKYYKTLTASSLTIENTKNDESYQLPEAGGRGTAIFGIVGSVLAAGAAVTWIAGKRKAKAGETRI